MAKNRKVKGFCGFCGDPVITGGRKYGAKWFHNPCYAAQSYGGPQNIRKGQRPRRSAPPWREMLERSEEELNPIESINQNPLDDLEILAHASNVTLAANPPGGRSMFYIWQGPRTAAANIVRFPTYNQANQYYRDVIDGKTGVSHNPSGSGGKIKVGMIVLGVAALGLLIYWLYRRNKLGKIKKLVEEPVKSLGFSSTVHTDGGFNGMK